MVILLFQGNKHESSGCLYAKGSRGIACLDDKYTVTCVFMVNGSIMANRETSEVGGEGIAVCSKGLISWVLTPVSRECGVMVKEGCNFFFSD